MDDPLSIIQQQIEVIKRDRTKLARDIAESKANEAKTAEENKRLKVTLATKSDEISKMISTFKDQEQRHDAAETTMNIAMQKKDTRIAELEAENAGKERRIEELASSLRRSDVVLGEVEESEKALQQKLIASKRQLAKVKRNKAVLKGKLEDYELLKKYLTFIPTNLPQSLDNFREVLRICMPDDENIYFVGELERVYDEAKKVIDAGTQEAQIKDATACVKVFMSMVFDLYANRYNIEKMVEWQNHIDEETEFLDRTKAMTMFIDPQSKYPKGKAKFITNFVRQFQSYKKLCKKLKIFPIADEILVIEDSVEEQQSRPQKAPMGSPQMAPMNY